MWKERVAQTGNLSGLTGTERKWGRFQARMHMPACASRRTEKGLLTILILPATTSGASTSRVASRPHFHLARVRDRETFIQCGHPTAAGLFTPPIATESMVFIGRLLMGPARKSLSWKQWAGSDSRQTGPRTASFLP